MSNPKEHPNPGRELHWLAVGVMLATALSLVHPHDGFTWVLEAAPVLVGLPLLLVTARRLPLSALCYQLLALHALVLLLGAHYTYGQVPLGHWLAQALDLPRNPYDRIGHFMQGFVPALVVREVLLRATPLRAGRALSVLTLCAALALSAAYELIEMAVALASGSAAEAFLGTQGDPWDTQWDMATALLGAFCALLLLGRAQDRALARAPTP